MPEVTREDPSRGLGSGVSRLPSTCCPATLQRGGERRGCNRLQCPAAGWGHAVGAGATEWAALQRAAWKSRAGLLRVPAGRGAVSPATAPTPMHGQQACRPRAPPHAMPSPPTMPSQPAASSSGRSCPGGKATSSSATSWAANQASPRRPSSGESTISFSTSCRRAAGSKLGLNRGSAGGQMHTAKSGGSNSGQQDQRCPPSQHQTRSTGCTMMRAGY